MKTGNVHSLWCEKFKPQTFRSVANRVGDRNGEATYIISTEKYKSVFFLECCPAVRLFCFVCLRLSGSADRPMTSNISPSSYTVGPGHESVRTCSERLQSISPSFILILSFCELLGLPNNTLQLSF
jgi:hypothetical protein